ncbi:odorant receptor 30a-like [Monomorium pharaonis]|uniref:odorant receptor 30a-like n=1 Tax=Monomorium pharaonis TaxID=307658 RepID=UPI0017462D21|nr:odorant receptor 30a-like [Monomorium pharaonis]
MDKLILLTLSCNVQLYLTETMPPNDDIAYAMNFLKFVTLPLGTWPLQKYDTFSLIRSIICSSSSAVLMITMFLELNFNNGNAYMKLDELIIVCCALLSVLKILFFRLYADKLIHNFTSAVIDYLAIDTEEKRTIMRRHAFLGRIIAYSTVVSGYLATTLFILMPMIIGDKNAEVNVSIKNQAVDLPVPLTWTLGNYYISTTSYFTIILVQYYLLLLNCNGNVGSDSLFLAITLHICGQMELLKTDFANYGTKSKNINKDFSLLISRHCYLMEHAKLLTEVISAVLLVQMLCSCFVICFVGLNLVLALKAHDTVMFTRCISAMMSFLLQLFSYSFVGDYLMCQMKDIADSMYSCNWYCFPFKFMRNFLFVIMRSQQPIQLLAGRYFVVNIETYMTILKSSLSYLSVLRVMMDA